MENYTKYTFGDFINKLDTFSDDFKNNACVEKIVIEEINQALPKKYIIIKADLNKLPLSKLI